MGTRFLSRPEHSRAHSVNMTGWCCSRERGVGTACPPRPRAKQRERERERGRLIPAWSCDCRHQHRRPLFDCWNATVDVYRRCASAVLRPCVVYLICESSPECGGGGGGGGGAAPLPSTLLKEKMLIRPATLPCSQFPRHVPVWRSHLHFFALRKKE